MFIKNWKKEIFTIPNILSLFRLVLIPVYAYIYLTAEENSQFFLAGAIMAVSCMTDMIDGKIARKFHMITTLGKILDPLADKLTQLTLTICLSLKYPVLYPVLGLFIIKELFQLVLGIAFLRKGKMLDGVCAGVAEYFGIDPTLVRLLWVLITFFWGTGVLLYVACMIIIPRKPSGYIEG